MIRRRGEILGSPRTTGGDQRNTDLTPDIIEHLQVETAGHAIGVHGVQQDLARPQISGPRRPPNSIKAGRTASAVSRDLISRRGGHAFRAASCVH